MPIAAPMTGTAGAALGSTGGALSNALAAAPSAGGGSLPWKGLEATGGTSGIDGTILFWIIGPDGKRKGAISQEEVRKTLEQRIKNGDLSPQQAFGELQRYGFTGGGYSDGSLVLGSFQGNTSTGREVTSGEDGRPTSGASVGSRAPGGSGGSGGRGSVSLGGGGGGGGSGGGTTTTSGGRPSVHSGGASWGPEPSGGAGGSSTLDLSAGAPGNGATRIDPNAPLGLDPSRAPGSVGPQGGSQTYRSGTLPTPGSILQGVNPNTSLNDLNIALVRRQEANRDAALGIYGGTLDEHANNPLLQGARQRGLDVLANPFSLDDQTVSRIMGQQGDLIGQNFARLKQQAADRAASSGVGRSGMAEAEQGRLDTNAVKALGDAQRGLLVEQATRRPKELQASLQSAGDFASRDYGQRADVATRAADSVYGQTSILGDALLSGVLMGGGAPQVRIATADSGPISSRYGAY